MKDDEFAKVSIHLDLPKIKEKIESTEWWTEGYYPDLEIRQVHLGYWALEISQEEWSRLDAQLASIGCRLEMSPGNHMNAYAHQERKIMGNERRV